MKKIDVVMIAISVAVVAAGLTYAAIATSAADTTAQRSAQISYEKPTRAELLELVNAERAKYGAQPLIEDARLNESAQRKADDMVKYNYFAHVNPNTGMDGYEYINYVGIYCKTDSENLHLGQREYSTSIETVKWWIESSAHHEAMIDTSYTLTGFGIAIYGDKSYVVEHFCEQ